MGVLPANPLARITYLENHGPVWQSVATQVGTTTVAVTNMTSKTTAARAAYNAQQTAIDAARAATLALQSAVNEMTQAGADIIKQIKTAAALSGSTNIYVLAQIPAPAAPSPAPPPGKPSDPKVTLLDNGAIELAWKCANPPRTQGTIYQVYRRTAPTAEFQFVGAVGSKKFTDDTLPSGSSQLTYQVTAVRSTARGVPAEFNVNFGVGGAGQMTATVGGVGPSTGGSPKLAA